MLRSRRRCGYDSGRKLLFSWVLNNFSTTCKFCRPSSHRRLWSITPASCARRYLPLASHMQPNPHENTTDGWIARMHEQRVLYNVFLPTHARNTRGRDYKYYKEAYQEYTRQAQHITQCMIQMKSTKVSNPRCISRIKPTIIRRGYWPHPEE